MKSHQGFTLIEGLVVLVLMAIMLSLSIQGLSGLQRRMDARAASEQLLDSIQQARNTAVSRGIPVSVCGSSNGTTCDYNWSVGLLAFYDPAGLGQPESHHLAAYHRIPHSAGSISWRSFSGKSFLQFDNRGRTPSSNGSFTYCPKYPDKKLARQVVLNRGGRPRQSRDKNGDGIHETADGSPISCN